MSYITVPAEKVKIAAEAVITRIMAIRTERDEEEISNVMTRTRYRFFFLKLSPFSREEAIKYLDNTYRGYSYWRSFYAWGDLDKAETLRIMAENGDPVNISNDDARLLWG